MIENYIYMKKFIDISHKNIFLEKIKKNVCILYKNGRFSKRSKRFRKFN